MATQLAEDKGVLGLDNPMGTDGVDFVTLEMPFGQAQLGRKGASHGHASR